MKRGQAPSPRKHSVLGLTALGSATVILCAGVLYAGVGSVLGFFGLTWRPWVQTALYLLACAALLALLCCVVLLLFLYAARRTFPLSGRILCGLGGGAMIPLIGLYCWLAFLFGIFCFSWEPEHAVTLEGEPVLVYYHSEWLEGGTWRVHGDRGLFLMTSDYETLEADYSLFSGGNVPEPFEAR